MNPPACGVKNQAFKVCFFLCVVLLEEIFGGIYYCYIVVSLGQWICIAFLCQFSLFCTGSVAMHGFNNFFYFSLEPCAQMGLFLEPRHSRSALLLLQV